MNRFPVFAVLIGAIVATAANAADHPTIGSFGFDLSGRDLAVKPGDNFFDYANGTYDKNLVIPPDQTRYGAFNVLHDLSESRTHDLLEAAAAHAPPQPAETDQKIGAFYKAFMDEAAIEKLGLAPLKGDLDLIRGTDTPAAFAHLIGLAPKTFLGSLFRIEIIPDPKDPTKYAIQLRQGGLGLPDRDYYLTPAFAEKRAAYAVFAANLLKLIGWPDSDKAAKQVVAFETAIAEASWSRAESRDDDKTYNPMSLEALGKAAPGIDWPVLFEAADLGKPAQIIVSQNTAIPKIAALAGKTPLGTLRAWAALHLAINAADVLPKDIVATNFDFFNKALQGQPEERPRWKRAVETVNATMGDAIGRLYVDRYFPPSSAAKMQALTQDLRSAFHARLEHNDWMAPETRQKALDKLGTFYFQIGNPKRWRDFGGLTIKADDLYGDVERGTAYEWAFWVGHLGHPVDRDQWDMFPQTVNAYNEPLLNEVVFPAAILQPPFFDPNADPAINYGGIGGVIGHEMTHSFDDQGRKHDAMGRLANWWTPEDVKKFEARAKKFGAQYAAMEILPGAHINPDLTMGENIADLGGLTMALDAYHASLHGQKAPVIDGLSGDQRVFLGWAQVWRAKVRPDRARQALTVDPHSPPIARVNGPMHNIDAWYAAFDVKPGEALYLAPEDRVKIW